MNKQIEHENEYDIQYRMDANDTWHTWTTLLYMAHAVPCAERLVRRDSIAPYSVRIRHVLSDSVKWIEARE